MVHMLNLILIIYAKLHNLHTIISHSVILCEIFRVEGAKFLTAY